MAYPVPTEYVTALAQSSQALMQQLGTALIAGSGQGVDFTRYMRLGEAQQQYLQDMGALLMGRFMQPAGGDAGPAGGSDRRFAAGSWRDSPYHAFLAQSYLIHSRYVTDLVESTSVDERTRARLRFFARQILDALSPSNFLATNPEAMRQAVESGGETLANGVKNLIADIGKGRLSMTDEQAFEVGGNLASTPGAVIFENELFQLIQYRPLTERVGLRPLLIVPPCINKYYVLDLQPANSLVRYAVEQGHRVLMISWRNIGPRQGHFSWDDYIEHGIVRAADVALAVNEADKVNAVGFCVGGTMLGCAAAVLEGRHEGKFASLTFLTTMLDFADAGEIGLLIDEASVASREHMIGRGGIMPGKELAFVFSTLRSNDLIWPYVVGNYLEGRQPDAFDILFWNADHTNLPGPMYAWYVRNTYLENNLRVPGKTVQCGVPVDLTVIRAPTYVFASRDDHIVPWQTAYRTADLVSGDVRFVLGASGHIAGVVNPASRNKRNFWVGGEPGGHAGRWLETAREVPGSWWPDWSNWLAPHRGDAVAAPPRLGSDRYREIEPAPGRYVKERAN